MTKRREPARSESVPISELASRYVFPAVAADIEAGWHADDGRETPRCWETWLAEEWLPVIWERQLAEELTGAEALAMCAFGVERIVWMYRFVRSDEIDVLHRQMEFVKQEHGLEADDDWPAGEGPPEYEAVSQEFDQAIDRLTIEAFREFGMPEYAGLLESHPDGYRRLLKIGRQKIGWEKM